MAETGYARDSAEYDRGLSFFDAIYGVAITLLVITVDPPAANDWDTWDALADSGVFGQLLTALVSFLVIAHFWRINHRLMGRVKQLDPATITANIVAAGFVVLIPFSTSALGEPGVSALALPTAVYATTIAAAGLAQRAIFVVAQRKGALPPVTNRDDIWVALLTPAVFLASVPLAFLAGSGVARWSWLSLAVLSPLAHRIADRRARRRTDTQESPEHQDRLTSA